MVSMKQFGLMLAMGGVFFTATGCKKGEQVSAESTAELKTEMEKVSYILGFSTGRSLSDQSVDINSNLFLSGMNEGLVKDQKAKFTEEEMRDIMQAFRNTLKEKRQKERDEASAKNLAEGEKFLTENKAKEGVVTLESGLQYRVVKEGNGKKPKAEDSVVVEYVGSLLNGKEFDSTKEHGQPATLPVNGTVKGMSEALQLMPVGSKWEIFIPASLAYGEQGAGALIEPNQTLKFEIELLSINEPQPENSPKPSPEASPKAKS